LKVVSSETVSFFLPFLLRAAITLRPFAEAILSRNPCLFFLFFFEGWNVRFIVLSIYPKRGAKMVRIYWICKIDQNFDQDLLVVARLACRIGHYSLIFADSHEIKSAKTFFAC